MNHRSRSLIAGFSLLVLSGCSGGSVGDITDVGPPGAVASIEITASATSVEPGGTLQLTATARDASGRTISNAPLQWSSNGPFMATVSSSGMVRGRSVGTPEITVTSTAGITGRRAIAVTAPARPPGSFLTVGRDSVFQHGGYSYLSTVGVVDTSRVGTDRRVGIMRLEEASLIGRESIVRSAFPQLSALAECPNGEVYAASYPTNQDAVRLYRVNPENATLVMFIRDPGTRTVQSMLCDSTNNLWMASEFASVGDLYWVNRTSRQIYFVRSYTNSPPVSIRGLAQSPTGMIYATIRPAFSSDGQLLATISQTNGAWTSVIPGQPYRFPIVGNLVFRSDRLFGLSGSNLVEIDTQTGIVTSRRTVSIP